ncbi:MAG: hypothetical protein WCO58_03100 [bacterium]
MKNFIKQLSFIFALGILFISGSVFAACPATVTNLKATQLSNTSFELSAQYDPTPVIVPIGTIVYIKPQIEVSDNSSFMNGGNMGPVYYPAVAQSYTAKGILKQTVSVVQGQMYFFRTVATVSNCGAVYDNNAISFMSPAPLPNATSVSMISVDPNPPTSATVTAKATFSITGAGPTDVYFVYGKNNALNNKTAVQTIAGQGPTTFTANLDLSIFAPGDTIYVKAVAGPATSTTSINFTIPKVAPQVYQCNDGIDNDADGYTDYPSDPACTSATDNDESPKNNANQAILGCTDNTASNYNPNATKDDGSCVYGGGSGIIYGCMDVNANNFNPHATRNNTPSSCVYGTGGGQSGCTDPKGLNYNPNATISDNSCIYQNNYVYGCTITTALNYNARATINDGTCIFSGGGTGGIGTGGTTQSGKPTAVTLIAKSATKTTATLAGIVYAPNTTANVYFEIFDANNVLLRSTPGQNLSVVGQSYYSFVATDLNPNSIYYYRLVASNNLGTSVGDKMFVQTQKVGSTKTTTRSGPVAPIVKGTSVTASSTLGASAVFGNGFFPTSFIGWLILLIIILFIIVIARVFFKKKQ